MASKIFKQFKGVDYSHSPVDVKDYRLSKMKNMINDGGIFHKRKGFITSDIGYFKPSAIIKTFGNNIKHIDKIVDGSDTYYLLSTLNEYFGSLVYKNTLGKKLSDYDDSYMNVGTPNGSITYSYNKLLNIGGKNVVVLDGGGFWEIDFSNLPKVSYTNENDSKALIYRYVKGSDLKSDKLYKLAPITTINIKEDGTNGGSLEEINRLTPYRTNTLIYTIGETHTWTLDGSIVTGLKSYIELSYTESGSSVTRYFSNGYEYSSSDYSGTPTTASITFSFSGNTFSMSNFDDTGKTDIKLKVTAILGNETEIKERLASIYGCSICEVFGENTNLKRLFMTGNPDYPNRLYYSDMDNPLYFPMSNYTDIGNSSGKIVALQVMNDNTLAVYKDGTNGDATVYYLQPKTTFEEDYYRVDFPYISGGFSESVLNQNCVCNFGNDKLIVTKNGVFAVTITNTTEKYIRNRSSLINSYLKKLDMSNAYTFVDGDRFYLVVGSEIFIADANYKFYESQLNPEQNFEYEWWHWTDFRGKSLFKLDDTLYAMSDNGLLEYKGFMDNDKLAVGSNFIGIVITGSYIYECNQVGDLYELKCNYYPETSSQTPIGSIYEYAVNGNYVKAKLVRIEETEIGGVSATVSILECAEEIELDDNTGTFFPCYITTDQHSVESSFTLPITNFNVSANKVLNAITIVPEGSMKGDCKLKVRTRFHSQDYEGKGGGEGYSFLLYDYDEYQYEGGFYASYRKRIYERFNFIELTISNDKEEDFALNSVEIEYKLINKIRGVK